MADVFAVAANKTLQSVYMSGLKLFGDFVAGLGDQPCNPCI